MLSTACSGFQQFSAATAKGVYSVGRLGRDWFRLTDSDGTDDRGLLALLSALDPARRILVIAKRESARRQVPSGRRVLYSGARLTAPIGIVLARLEVRSG